MKTHSSSLTMAITRSNSTQRPMNTTEPMSHEYNIILVVILSALIPLALIGNTLVCVAFIKYKRLRTATNCFLFSLALSDLTVALLLIPCWIAYTMTGFSGMPKNLDTAWTILDITCSVASMTNLASVSIERWYGVSYPFLHMGLGTSKATLMACLSWLYALGTAMFFFAEPREWAFTVMTVVGVCLPFLVTFVSYMGIARKIKIKMAERSQQSGRERKTIRTLIVVTVIFLICWLPFIVISLLTNYCQACADYVIQRPALHTFPKALHYSSSCVNPLLYALLSPSFKSAFQQLFCGGTKHSRDASRGRYGSSVNGQSVMASRTKNFNLTTSSKEKRTSLDRNSLLFVGQTAV